MTSLAERYAAETVRLAADDERPAPKPRPATRTHPAWDDLPVIPSGLDPKEPF